MSTCADLTPTLLLILDGWGLAKESESNAPFLAHTPNLDKLFARCPHSQLQASGRAVGLPEGYIGNSEVGHLNIGAGSVVYQDMTRIDVAMESGELASNATFKALMEHCQKEHGGSGRLHLAGLLSDGGVHSHYKHMEALVKIAVERGLEVFIHCFMDGRDTPPHSGEEFVRILQDFLLPFQGKARIASLCGRFYCMDRDTRWDRVEKAWNMLVHGQGERASDALEAVKAAYAADLSDEFIVPTLLAPEGSKEGTWQDGDGVFFFNFRADRMRELVQALTLPHFDGFERGKLPELCASASMTCYDSTFILPVAFPKDSLTMGLGEVVSSWGCKQLRIAETEKYAHVTYFFNGGREEPFDGEDRILVPSPRSVATYDLAPGMSGPEVTKKCVEALQSKEYTLVVCNLANGDMVGHTGVLSAAIAACETVDACVGEFIEAIRTIKGRMLLIADHGNCESMLDADGQPQTAHTTNPVPCILVQENGCVRLQDGKLADVAPTLIKLWNKDVPASMNGTSLVESCA